MLTTQLPGGAAMFDFDFGLGEDIDLLRSTVYEHHRWSAAEWQARVAPFATMDEAELTPLKAVLVVRRRHRG